MLRYFQFLLLLGFVLPGFSQQEPGTFISGSLNTVGKARLSVAPDEVITYLSVSRQDMDYAVAIQKLNEQTSVLEKEIVVAGFKKEDLKTRSFNVRKNTIWRNGRTIDSGYIAIQSFSMEYEFNNAKIARLVKVLSGGKVATDLSFSFGLSDKKQIEVNKELIKLAVKDASEKAQTIADASGVVLGKILRIDYGTPVSAPVPYKMNASAAAAEFSGFNAKNLELSDSITITWKIATTEK